LNLEHKDKSNNTMQ